MAEVLDFPYTLEDEPTEHWTVEQVLNWWLLQSKSETDASLKNDIERLQHILDEGMQSLWEDHGQIVKTMADGNENADPRRGRELAGKGAAISNGKEKRAAAGTVAAVEEVVETRSDELQYGTFRVQIIGGHYAGTDVVLKPTGSKFCWVGRSQSKKFQRNGISLPQDGEVSTSHGKFYPGKGGSIVYIDDGSTNGSWINGKFIERHVEYPLENGMEIVVGATIMKITLPQ